MYRFHHHVPIDGDAKVLSQMRIILKLFWCPKVIVDRHLGNSIRRTIGYCGRCPCPIVAFNTYRNTPKLTHCGSQYVSIPIISNLLLLL